jgi:rRNA maturation endonuclease Nob1
MAAKAGEIARETATYSCQGCRRAFPVHEGVPISKCPSCGNESFHTGARAPREMVVAAPPGFASFP